MFYLLFPIAIRINAITATIINITNKIVAKSPSLEEDIFDLLLLLVLVLLLDKLLLEILLPDVVWEVLILLLVSQYFK